MTRFLDQTVSQLETELKKLRNDQANNDAQLRYHNAELVKRQRVAERISRAIDDYEGLLAFAESVNEADAVFTAALAMPVADESGA